MNTLVIGLGNPILGDDGVGWRVAEEVEKRLANRTAVRVDCFALGGLSLMEQLTDSERVILIDSIFTGTKPIGTVSMFPLDDLADQTSGHTASTHDTSLRNALKVGRSMNIPLPDDENVTVVAVEAEAVFDFSEKFSAPVEAAIPIAVDAVLKLLAEKGEKP